MLEFSKIKAVDAIHILSVGEGYAVESTKLYIITLVLNAVFNGLNPVKNLW